MKKKIFAMIAVILCLSMLVVSCKKKDKDDDGEEATTKSNEAIILDYLNGDDSALGDIQGAAYDMIADLKLEMTNVKIDGEKFIDSAILSGGKLYMSSGESVMYTAFDKSLATVSLEYGASGMTSASVSIPDSDGAEGENSPEIPKLTDADLVDEGNGVYSVSKEYIIKAIEAAVTSMAGEETEDESFKEELNTLVDMLEDTDISIKITVDGEQVTKVEESFKADKAVCTAFIKEISDLDDLGLDYIVDVTSTTELKDGAPKKMTAKMEMCYPVDSVSGEGEMCVVLVKTGMDAVIDLTKLDASATVAELSTYTNTSYCGFKQSGDKYVADKSVTDKYAGEYGSMNQKNEMSIKEGKFSFTRSMTSGSETMSSTYAADISFEEKAIPELSAAAKEYVEKADKIFKNIDTVKMQAADIGDRIAANLTDEYSTVIYHYAEYDIYVVYDIYTYEGKTEVLIDAYNLIDDGYADYRATVSGANVTLTPITPV